MNIRLATLMITALPFLAKTVLASDFFGAIVTDKDVPTITWKAGIDGIRPIIDNVTDDSPASKSGLKRGDIILSINNKDVRRSSDLGKFNGDTLQVRTVNGTTWNDLTIDRRAIEAEKAKLLTAERKATTPAISRSPRVNTTQDNLPPLKFDDAALGSMYGKTPPAELAWQRQSSERVERNKSAGAVQNKQIRARESQQPVQQPDQISTPLWSLTGRAKYDTSFVGKADWSNPSYRDAMIQRKKYGVQESENQTDEQQVQSQQRTYEQPQHQPEPQQKQYFLTNGGTMTTPPGSAFSTTSKGETYFSPEGSAFSYGTGGNAGKTCFHFGAFADCK